MDQPSADMQSETQKPRNQKNNENSPKHVNSQTTAQLFRDREALNLFASRWEPGSAETKNARIQFATSEFGGFTAADRDKAINPPLSWAMNPAQIKALKDGWTERVNGKGARQNDPHVTKVHCFFHPAFSGCANMTRQPEARS